MSSWWVLAALGLYPAIPGEDVLAIGSPMFPRTRTIEAGRRQASHQGPGTPGPAAPTCAVCAFDGKAAARAVGALPATHATAGRLNFDLAAEPQDWGNGPQALRRPRSGPGNASARG